jgi:putative ABC transport system substrate-binding protein
MRRREAIFILAGGIIIRRALGAEQKGPPVIGFIGSSSSVPFSPYLAAFRRGLREAGYVESENVRIEYRWADRHLERLPELAAELVAHKVDVISVAGTVGILAAKGATATIPIIFLGGGDLVADGLVTSLARPGGNLTGISIMATELTPKRFDLLSELVPYAKVVGLLVNPNSPAAKRTVRNVQEIADAKDVQLRVVQAAAGSDFEAVFASLSELNVQALEVAADPFFNDRREQLVSLASRFALPAIYEWREFVELGGLMSYGPSQTDLYRQVGAYVGRVLRGEKPADLPVQEPAKFELVINLNTAKALGLTVPQSILARADEVIE